MADPRPARNGLKRSPIKREAKYTFGVKPRKTTLPDPKRQALGRRIRSRGLRSQRKVAERDGARSYARGVDNRTEGYVSEVKTVTKLPAGVLAWLEQLEAVPAHGRDRWLHLIVLEHKGRRRELAFGEWADLNALYEASP